MLRESIGYQTNGQDEIDRLCRAAEAFAALEVDGVVLGFLNDGEVDVELTQRVLAYAPHIRATFHHAFEDAKDKRRAINEIKRLPQVDRILSSGGTDVVVESSTTCRIPMRGCAGANDPRRWRHRRRCHREDQTRDEYSRVSCRASSAFEFSG